MNANVRVKDSGESLDDLGRLLASIRAKPTFRSKKEGMPKASFECFDYINPFMLPVGIPAKKEELQVGSNEMSSESSLDHIKEMIADVDAEERFGCELEHELAHALAAVNDSRREISCMISRNELSNLPSFDDSAVRQSLAGLDSGIFLSTYEPHAVSKSDNNTLYLEIGLESSALLDFSSAGKAGTAVNLRLHFGKASLLPFLAPGLDAFFESYDMERPKFFFFTEEQLSQILQKWSITLYGRRVDLSAGRELAAEFLVKAVSILLDHAPRHLSQYSQICIIADRDISGLLGGCMGIAPNIVFDIQEE